MWNCPRRLAAARSAQAPPGIDPTHRQQQHRRQCVSAQHIAQPMLAEVQARWPHQSDWRCQKYHRDGAEPGALRQGEHEEEREAEQHRVLDDVTTRKAWRIQGSQDADKLR